VNVHTQLEIGSEFLGYRIEELVGRGGMGVVYRAYDLRLKRTVALKLIAPDLALDERFRERFTRESEVAMTLEHPNVVPIYDAGDVDGRVYLAMRYVEGTDLRTLLRAEGALDPTRALAICSQMAAALDAAHATGLVHRDVKPANVLLDPSDHVYLADFGLTRRLEEPGLRDGEGRSLGTPTYLAPEQIEDQPVDGRADVYSLGCLVYECLTGEPPFAGRSRLAVAWAHLEEDPPNASEHKSGLPEAIDPVIRKAMAKEPDDHYLFWRPYTAIRHADLDGNSATEADPNWLPLLNTPNHPEYPAAHGCFTAALAEVVAKVLHTRRIDLTVWGATNGGTTLTTTRHFETVKDLEREVVDARVWIGFHYRHSGIAGVRLGREVAHWSLQRYFRPIKGRCEEESDDD
jgi:serine/threonine protein kinase